MTDTFVSITGNLTDDPELRYTTSGVPVTNFRLAVTPRVKDGEGWKDGETSFYRIAAWRSLAENVAETLAKGARVMVTGSLKVNSWETPEGDKRSVVEVQADEVGPSLKWATATVAKASPGHNGRGPAVTNRPADTTTTKGGQFDTDPPF